MDDSDIFSYFSTQAYLDLREGASGTAFASAHPVFRYPPMRLRERLLVLCDLVAEGPHKGKWELKDKYRVK